MEALPTEDNYRRLSKIMLDQRPTMDELMAGQKAVKTPNPVNEPPKVLKGKVVKFGWIEGVLMRCLLNIWGVMLFLRLSWVIGQAGFWQGLLIISTANLITAVTAISMSAVATNGQIASGGVYYMISRALGPEFGGAIGLMFTIANSINVAVHTIGFCDNLLDLVHDMVPTFNGIIAVEEGCKTDCRINDLRIIGAPVIALILGLAIIGMDWVTRVQKFLLVTLIFSQLDIIVGSCIPGENLYVSEAVRTSRGFTGWSVETFWENFDPNYNTGDNGRTAQDFISVFGVYFTAVTGIVAGANLSGDLKDPSSAIPKGTLLAIGLTYFSYMFFGLLVSFNFLPDANGLVHLNFTETDVSDISVCGFNSTCPYGSSVDQKVMVYISYTGYLVYFGCYAAALSSAIASLVGAPRVLQAVARDKLYPKIEFFAKGHGANNDPFRGYILVFVIAFGCLMIGSLNTIGKVASNFFLAAYALMNLSVFHSSMTRSPGWRPSFKFYSPWVSLAGSLACVCLMFAMEPILAMATAAIIALLYGLISYLKPDTNWGSSAEALTFITALNSCHNLSNIQDHAKTYRPKILVMSGNPAHRQPLVDFANLITKKLSLLVCANIVVHADGSDQPAEIGHQRETIESWLKDHGIRSFYTEVQAESYSTGVKNCLSLVGIGKLTPNMLLLGFKQKLDLVAVAEYVEVLTVAFEKSIAVGVLRLPYAIDCSGLIGSEETFFDSSTRKQSADELTTVLRDKEGQLLNPTLTEQIQQFRLVKGKPPHKGTIDVWWLYDDGGLTLLLPHIIRTRRLYRDCQLRVFSLSNRPDNLDKDTRSLATLLTKFRIDHSEVLVVPDVTKKASEATISAADLAANAERTNRNLRLGELLREHSCKADLVVASLPLPRRGQAPPALYLAWLDIMTRGLPPVLLTRGNQTSVLTFDS
jgi:solute carrier family 12 sodium/potassium/chloride transporter 2